MKKQSFVVGSAVYIKNKYVGDVEKILPDGRYLCGFWEARAKSKGSGIFEEHLLQHVHIPSLLGDKKPIHECLGIPFTYSRGEE